MGDDIVDEGMVGEGHGSGLGALVAIVVVLLAFGARLWVRAFILPMGMTSTAAAGYSLDGFLPDRERRA